MKKVLTIISAILCIAACSPKKADVSIAVTGVGLTKDGALATGKTFEMVVGDVFSLNAIVTPEDATNKEIEWKSSNASVATVGDGLVTAVAVGKATITVTTADGGKTASCTVNVSPLVIPVASVSLKKDGAALAADASVEVYVGDAVTLEAVVSPDNADNKAVSWTSSETSVATVAEGVVTAVAVGTSTITVTTADGGKTASCSINVVTPPVHVESVSLDKSMAFVEIGKTITLVASVAPDDADNKKVSWTSSDVSKATVSEDGVVTGIAAGSATITVTSEDGNKTATCSIVVEEVYTHVESITLDITSREAKAGDSFKLTATVAPADARFKDSLTWTSSNPAVATVSADGTVTVLGSGAAVITASERDGAKGSCTVTIAANSSGGSHEGYGDGGKYNW